MSAPEQPTPGALEAAVDHIWPHYTDSAKSKMDYARTSASCTKLALLLDRFAAQRAAEAVAELRCAACDGHYSNPDCPHLRNARDMGERIPCVPAQAATPPPGDAVTPAQIRQIIEELEQPHEAHTLARSLEQCWPLVKAALLAYHPAPPPADAGERARTPWQPIETAPKIPEQKLYLLLFNGHHVGVGYYWATDFDEPEHEWCDESGDFIEPPPTHWQPLPEPPRALATPQESEK